MKFINNLSQKINNIQKNIKIAIIVSFVLLLCGGAIFYILKVIKNDGNTKGVESKALDKASEIAFERHEKNVEEREDKIEKIEAIQDKLNDSTENKQVIINNNNEIIEITFDDILFDTNKATIRPDEMQELDKLAETIKSDWKYRVDFPAHADKRGSNKYNMSLSYLRYVAVKDYLLHKGIPSIRFKGIPLGETKPIVDCDKCTADELQKNRSVQIILHRKIGYKW